MEPIVNITKDHPHEWKAFRRWHALACTSDPLTAEERFIKEGHKLPTDDDPGTKKKIK
jgi:hypothetical protein